MNTNELELNIFKEYYERLQTTVNPTDIAEHLWCGKYDISIQQKEEAYDDKYSEYVRMGKLLPHVEITIKGDWTKLYTFLEFLNRFSKYKRIVQEMRSDLAGEL